MRLAAGEAHAALAADVNRHDEAANHRCPYNDNKHEQPFHRMAVYITCLPASEKQCDSLAMSIYKISPGVYKCTLHAFINAR